MAVRGWRAWFTGPDAVYRSDEVDPADLPDDGCLGVVVYLDLETPKRAVHTGYDIYFWWPSPHGLVIAGNSDPRDENERRYPGAVFVRGQWTTYEHMHAVREAMQEAQTWP